MAVTEAPEKMDRSISTWRGLLLRAGFASVVVVIVVQILAGGVIPPLLVGAVLLAIGLFWLRRGGRGPVIYLTVVSVLFLLANLGFAIPALGHPESAFDFVSVGAILISLVVTAGVALATLRSQSAPGRAPRLIGLGSFGLFLVLAVIGGIAAAGLEDDGALPGDLTLGAKSVKWTQTALTAKAGEVAILIDNADATRHDFVIKKEGAKVKEDLPELTKRRVTFTARPDTYEYVCTIHPEMKGTLTVS